MARKQVAAAEQAAKQAKRKEQRMDEVHSLKRGGRKAFYEARNPNMYGLEKKLGLPVPKFATIGKGLKKK